MKRLGLAVIFAFLLAQAAFSTIIGLQFEPKAFDDKTYTILIFDTEDQLKVKPLESQSYDFAFRDKQGRYEVRYILFSQTGKISDYKTQVAVWCTMVIQNATGSDAALKNTSAFKDADVKAEFSADYGLTSFAKDTDSDFTEGYKFVMLNFFYKKDLGIICEAILFNDLDFAKTDDFDKVFHSVKFN